MSKTGKRFNDGKLRWRNVPLYLFEDVIKVGQFGESKYGTFNFLDGLPILDTLDSLKRHLTAFENPYMSDIDEESKQNHLASVAWNAIVALEHLKTRPELDDRYKVNQVSADSAGLTGKEDNYKYNPFTRTSVISTVKEEIEHDFKFEMLDVVKVGALTAQVQEPYYNTDFEPMYILRTEDGKIFTEKEYMLEMAPVKIGE